MNEDTTESLKARISELEDQLDLMVDEFTRISLFSEGNDEVTQLCMRAIQTTKQIVPMIEQRDKYKYDLEKTRQGLIQIFKWYDAGDGHMCTMYGSPVAKKMENIRSLIQ